MTVEPQMSRDAGKSRALLKCATGHRSIWPAIISGRRNSKRSNEGEEEGSEMNSVLLCCVIEQYIAARPVRNI